MATLLDWIIQLSLQERLLLGSLVCLLGAGLLAAAKTKRSGII